VSVDRIGVIRERRKALLKALRAELRTELRTEPRIELG
jgi:hypothetical protein